MEFAAGLYLGLIVGAVAALVGVVIGHLIVMRGMRKR